MAEDVTKICAFLLIFTMAIPVARAADADFAPDLAERVLVVFNAESCQSKEVADYYIARRGIPASNQCSVKPGSADGPGNETIDVAAFDRLIKKPIQRCLTAVGKDKILYIVLAYGTPYKVSARPGLGMAVD
jgi:uncharacterized protein (TIGR03790 family)